MLLAIASAAKIVVKVHSGSFNKDHDQVAGLGGKMDPYLILKFGDQEQRGKTIENGGKTPQFNQTFEFNIIDNSHLKIEVFDNDTGNRDDKIGELKFTIAELRKGISRKNHDMNKWLGLRSYGTLNLEVEYRP